MISQINRDKLGIYTSALCAIHCLALPLFLVIGAEAIINIAYSETTDILIQGLVFTIGVFSFIPGYMRHRQHYILVLFFAGFLLIILGEGLQLEAFKLVVPVIGAAIIIYTHYMNFKILKERL